MLRSLKNQDKINVLVLRKIQEPLARLAIFIVYFWFGLLKVLEQSPAGPLVESLHEKTIPFIPFHEFYLFFSGFEMLIGILFLIKGWERVAIALMLLHLFTTVLPLIFLPELTWQRAFVPTLEGQYIIKNILLVALAVTIGSRIHLEK